MSWLFSQALVAAYSGAISSDGEPSAPLSGNPTQLAYLPPDRMTAFSRPSRSGMTFRPLTDDLGAAVLTSYLAAFPARISASRGGVQESTENAAGCGGTWRGSLARFDPATSSWRTAQPSLLEDLGESSVIWPRSGMTAAGQCWELPTLAPPTSVTGSGLWPTPTTQDNPQIKGEGKATAHPNSSGRPAPGKQTQLVDAVRFATPLSRDWRSGKASQETHDKNSRPLSEQIGGSLNPTWVEWLMGWPLGWTDLKPLEMARCPSVPQLRGGS